ncbi:endonuclease [Malaciobacter molluscorum]|uniref:endonuclease/exonuclease/phosphatase family protein n=1 Tax=Malaciobacter molluscorum TaxID=1032072 RepID=UPI00100ACFAC|nr:endonuclease/exonuclease/phosphatase family protein [Malaciobacter molluscorum]RXJ96487.1 endonuclease [Malaciobacter molluscorum]
MNIKIGTFNLFQFVKPPYSWYIKKDKFDDIQWEKKSSWIKNQLILMNCDIVGFQEVFSTQALKELVQSLGYQYFTYVDKAKVSQENKNIFISTTVALASKYPIIETKSVNIDNNFLERFEHKDAFEFARIPIKATIKIDNYELITYVIHLKSNRLNEYEYKFNDKNTINEKLKKIIPSINRGNSPALKQRLIESFNIASDILKTQKKYKNICVLGDLNDRQNSLCIDILTNKKCQSITFLKEYETISFEKVTFMYDSYNKTKRKEKRRPTSYYKTVGNILDYIFVSKDIDVLKFEHFDLHLKDNKDGSILQSDHAQIVAQLSIK